MITCPKYLFSSGLCYSQMGREKNYRKVKTTRQENTMFYFCTYSSRVRRMYNRNENCSIWQRNTITLTCKKAAPRESPIKPLYWSLSFLAPRQNSFAVKRCWCVGDMIFILLLHVTPHILDSPLPLRLWIQNIVQIYHKNLLRIIIQTNYHKLSLLKIIPLFPLLSLGIWKYTFEICRSNISETESDGYSCYTNHNDIKRTWKYIKFVNWFNVTKAQIQR